MDRSRHFPVKDLDADPDRGDAYYRLHIKEIYDKCINGVRRHQKRHHQKVSLYTGSLGACCYLPYCLATSQCFPFVHLSSNQSEKARCDMLMNALSFAEEIRQQQYNSMTFQRVTLLEGGLIGSLVIKILISNALLLLVDNLDNKRSETIVSISIPGLQNDMESCKEELLQFGEAHVLPMPSPECEIFYGRAGYLKAISLVRAETSDPEFGASIAQRVIKLIWDESKRFSADANCSLPVMWEWHSKMYLGAAHGVTGILHSLLDFKDELLQIDPNAQKTIECAVTKLNGYCFESGNLISSIPQTGRERDFMKKSDHLVQFCHGAPGHVFLLTQLYHTATDGNQTSHDSSKYLSLAKGITESVILPRGLLRKGVGLCHGISGNAYCFLSIWHAELKGKQMNK